MAKYNFQLKDKETLDNIRSPYLYRFNLARNLALMSDDAAVIRRFYQVEAPKLLKDEWLQMEIKDKFLAQYREGQAFAYFGICPMIVQGKVNLLASNGFECQSEDKEIDRKLNEWIEDAELQSKFAEGVYLESGLGDFLYRLSYDPKIGDKPIIDVIEPQNFEVNYSRGQVKSYVIKVCSEEDPTYELREIYYRNESGRVCVTYRFVYDEKYVDPRDRALVKECAARFSDLTDLRDRELPLPDFPIVFKKNANANRLYRGERGIPDIQGLDTIEDALTETLSDLIDAIRKGGLKEYIDDSLIPQDQEGNDLRFDPFNKTIIVTRGSSNPANPKSLYQVTQGEINWEAYVKTMQNLMSVAINKAGLSPTTLGLTGLESINSSAESQEAREKTSLRTRELCLKSWAKTLKDLLNKYLQMTDYIRGKEILDYRRVIKIHFEDYISPSVENVTDVLARQVQAGIKSQAHAIMDLNPEYEEEDAEREVLDILTEKGQPVLQDGGPESVEDMENSALENANFGNSDPLENANSGNSDPSNANWEDSAPKSAKSLKKG